MVLIVIISSIRGWPFFRSLNTTSSGVVIIAWRTCMLPRKGGIGILGGSIWGRMLPTLQEFLSMWSVLLELVRIYLFQHLKCSKHSWIPAGRTVPLAATRVYQMSFFTGFGVSAIIYYLLNLAFPVPGNSKQFEEVDVSNFDHAHWATPEVESTRDSKELDKKVDDAWSVHSVLFCFTNRSSNVVHAMNKFL